jgi:hypothetical protein
MAETYRIKVKTNQYEVEVESTEKEFVVQKIEEHLRSFRGSSQSETQHNTTQQSGAVGGKDLSLQEFINRIKPSSGPEHVVTIGYFLEKHQSLPAFTSGQIKSEFQRAKFQHPNPTDALLKARAAGKVMDGPEKGSFVLTRTGEQWVEGRLTLGPQE